MKRSIFSLLAMVVLASACHKDSMDDKRPAAYYANTFAFNTMNTYYLWKDEPEVASELQDWTIKEEPIEKVTKTRYKADRWTRLYDDTSSFETLVTGSGKTFGLEYKPYYYDEEKTRVIAVVLFTYAGSPACNAGLKRGDGILTVNGEIMTPDNYGRILNQLYTETSLEMELADGRTVRMDAIEMYENPVHTVSLIEYNGVRYGYLHFSNFTLDACKDLETAFAQLKAVGIQELVLDLRYNTGGYAFTSMALASMMAPPEVVSGKKVFNRDIYNDIISGEEKAETYFTPECTYTSNITKEKVTVKPLDVNPGIRHLWVLVTGSSASASEALICGLKPYMDVTVVGGTTSGKFCGGNFIKATDWYTAVEKDNGLKNIDYDDARQSLSTWGIYVITSRYADCNGVTLSMPDGIPADISGEDVPYDGYELGDPRESLLSSALGAVKSVPEAPYFVPVEQTGYRSKFSVLLH